MTEETSETRSVSNHDRLNGWKEIAVHLGKSVRTVQRWELELRLPVHRIRTAGGEIVFAFRSELDKRQAEVDQFSVRQTAPNGRDIDSTDEIREEAIAEDAKDEESRLHARMNGGAVPKASAVRKFRWIAVAALLVTGAVVWAGWRYDARGRVERQPFAWRVMNDTLHVFNLKNEQLWEHHFNFSIDESAYLKIPVHALQKVSIDDLDGDGDKELLFVAITLEAQEFKLYCFNWDGSERFVLQPSREVTYGEETFTPPYPVRGFEVTREASGAKSIWVVAVHNLWFPSVVEKVSPRGDVLGEYWSNGHVEAIREGTSRGRRVLLVGATDNEQIAASLAALDFEHPSGSAPAVNPKYRCRNCPEGSPLSFLVFPPMEIAKELKSRPKITQVRDEPNGEFVVDVLESSFRFPGESDPSLALAFYRLSPEFRVVSAETGDAYWKFHAQLEFQKRLNHRYGPKCEKQLFPVLSRNGGEFVKLTADVALRPSSEKTLAMAKK